MGVLPEYPDVCLVRLIATISDAEDHNNPSYMVRDSLKKRSSDQRQKTSVFDSAGKFSRHGSIL